MMFVCDFIMAKKNTRGVRSLRGFSTYVTVFWLEKNKGTLFWHLPNNIYIYEKTKQHRRKEDRALRAGFVLLWPLCEPHEFSNPDTYIYTISHK